MGDDENKNSSPGLNIVGNLTAKLTKKMIVAIAGSVGGGVFFIIIIVIVIIIVLLGGGLAEEEEEEESSSSYSDSSWSSSDITIIEKEGLSFLTDSSYFCFPVTNMTGISATFGQAGSSWSTGYHTGLDFLAPAGSSVVAVADGTVIYSGYSSSYGNHVIIEHNISGKTFYTMYCHMNELEVSKGNTVVQGSVLGIIGTTGNVTGLHCHFEFSYSSAMFRTSLDPMTNVFEEHVFD